MNISDLDTIYEIKFDIHQTQEKKDQVYERSGWYTDSSTGENKDGKQERLGDNMNMMKGLWENPKKEDRFETIIWRITD